VLYLTLITVFVAAMTGIVAVVKQRERPLLIYLIVVFGGALSTGALIMLVGAMLGGA
jgi:hypothetical protein